MRAVIVLCLIVPLMAQFLNEEQFYGDYNPEAFYDSYLPLNAAEYFEEDVLPLQDTSYSPQKETPEEYFKRLPEYDFPSWRATVEKMYKDSLGKPLPDPSPATLARIDKKLNDAEVQEHNRLRAQHGSPKLRYDEKLAAFAQNFADRMGAKMAQGYSFQHNQQTKVYKVGENMAGEGPEIDYTGNYARRWYSEIEQYKRNGNRASTSPDPKLATGHFTQVVWKKSEKIGCGRSCYNKRGRKECLVICNYYPAGNMYNMQGQPDEVAFNKNVQM